VIDQREVGSDTGSFEAALRRVLRQDPDVILIGEMRDEATVRTALAAAETGHLVLSTLHTLDAPETVNRILDFFTAEHHAQAAGDACLDAEGHRLAAACAARRRQRPRRDHRGPDDDRTSARLHSQPERDGDLADVLAQGEYYGMQTFDQALYAAVQSGDVAVDDALRYASAAARPASALRYLQRRLASYSARYTDRARSNRSERDDCVRWDAWKPDEQP